VYVCRRDSGNERIFHINRFHRPVVRHSDRACGMHFFNPVPLMKREDIIPGLFTAPVVVQTVRKLSGRIGKTSVLAKEDPGFLVNFGGRA
jgi:3-hydroxybutyryl-CoA dehydrogenase